uniref:(northern house mosquito) hypothetical protein n=1 Tax=Culex pipiens TaxID=7175 RepID=A0A8D8AE93_CULPI
MSKEFCNTNSVNLNRLIGDQDQATSVAQKIGTQFVKVLTESIRRSKKTKKMERFEYTLSGAPNLGQDQRKMEDLVQYPNGHGHRWQNVHDGYCCEHRLKASNREGCIKVKDKRDER